MKASDFHLPDERLDHIFDRPSDSEDRSQTVREAVFGGYPAGLQEPTLVLLGGQPGAGKSSAIAAVSRERAGELVPLSGDDLRPFHDDFEMLARDHPWLMPNATSQASGAWVRRCIDYALEHRHSLLLEGVFRDPLTVAQTIDRFAAAGYRVEVVGVATSYRDSLLASLGRFLHPEEGAAPRWTPATAHDSAYRTVPFGGASGTCPIWLQQAVERGKPGVVLLPEEWQPTADENGQLEDPNPSLDESDH